MKKILINLSAITLEVVLKLSAIIGILLMLGNDEERNLFRTFIAIICFFIFVVLITANERSEKKIKDLESKVKFYHTIFNDEVDRLCDSAGLNKDCYSFDNDKNKEDTK